MMVSSIITQQGPLESSIEDFEAYFWHIIIVELYKRLIFVNFVFVAWEYKATSDVRLT